MLKLEWAMEPRIPCEIGDLSADGNMVKAGIELNDKIIGVNGEPITFYDEFIDQTSKEINTAYDLTILRVADTLQFSVRKGENGLLGREEEFDFRLEHEE